MEFLKNAGMAVMVGTLMAVYYFVMFLVFGLLVWTVLAIVDAFAKTNFAPRYRAWLAGVQDWRKGLRKSKDAPDAEDDEAWEKS